MAKSVKNQNAITRVRKWKYTGFVAIAALATALAITIFAVNQKGLTTTSQHASGFSYTTPYGTPYGYPLPRYGYPYPNPPNCGQLGGSCINSTICRNNCSSCQRLNCPVGQSCCR